MIVRRGYTIIELLVAMGLFAIFSVLMITSFVSFTSIHAKSIAMKDSQQKIRSSLDQMIKQTKEATSVTIDTTSDPNNKVLTLYFKEPNAAARYSLKTTSGRAVLNYSECNITGIMTGIFVPCTDIDSAPIMDVLIGNPTATASKTIGSITLDFANSTFAWNSPQNIAGDQYNMDPSVKIKLKGTIFYSLDSAERDNFDLETIISLERK
jgi:prepilin-type N-terminal cleavage/methylation domain-containing protein